MLNVGRFVKGRPSGFKPVSVGTLELSEVISGLEVRSRPDGAAYERALLLVTLHRQPLGLLEVELNDGRIDATQLTARVWVALGDRIAAHLGSDGLQQVSSLSAEGIPTTATPPCLTGGPPDDAAPFVSVIVPTHNRPEQLATCLQGLTALDYPRFEVIVVDNAPSTQATAELVKNRYGGDHRIRYVLEPRRGSSRARNRGLAEARGEIIAFTDDDVLVDRYWLRSLVRGFSRAPGVVSTTGTAPPAELETPSQLWFESANLSGSKFGFEPRLFDLEDNRLPSRVYPYLVGAYGGGNNMAFDAGFLRSIGGWDEALGAGSPAGGAGDLDLLLRVVTSGHRIAFEPSAIVWHIHRGSLGAARRQVFNYGVGLSALLTKHLFSRKSGPELLVRAPQGLLHLLSPASPRNEQKADRYPFSLTVLELVGMLCGPVIYVRSRRWARVGAQ
jgi:O-antigen biosynthesis protein